MTDHELLSRYCAESDQAAFAELVRRYVNLVYSTALRRTGERELAEDVTQTVFLILSQRGGGLSGKVVVAGWLYQTARNVANDALRARERRRRHENRAA